MTAANVDHSPFSAEGFASRAAMRLSQRPDPDAGAVAAGDHDLNPDLYPAGTRPRQQPAAVLAPIVARPGGATVLLTRRASHLRNHSSQIPFPGGKIDASDVSPQAAALREAREEIGLDERHVRPIGWLDPYQTGSGFRVYPLVGIVDAAFTLEINRHEVEEVFEAPLEFLMNPRHHLRVEREINGVDRAFYAMPWGDRYIWGATAGMLLNLYRRLYAP